MTRTIDFLVTTFIAAIAALMIVFALAGCAESAPDRCLRYGFTPHTDGFSNCMLQLDNQ